MGHDGGSMKASIWGTPGRRDRQGPVATPAHGATRRPGAASWPRPAGRRRVLAIRLGACVLALTALSVPSGARAAVLARIAGAPIGRLRPVRPDQRPVHVDRVGGRLRGFDDGLDDGLDDGVGFGLAGGLVGAGLQAPGGRPYGDGPFPPGPPAGYVPTGAPPCVRPQVIRIGGGPRRNAVRVLYGTPPCGS